jgi:predicted GNAT superfamily acetyltransferase
LVAEWQLDSPRVIAAIENLVASPTSAPAAIAIPVELEQWRQEDAQRVQAVQARVREEFTQWFARGYAAIAVRAGENGTEYLLGPWSDF